MEMDLTTDLFHRLETAITNLRVKETRSLLDELGIGEQRESLIKERSDLIFTLVKSACRDESSAVAILYMLIDAGADVNYFDFASNESALSLAESLGNLALCDVLLQCGSSLNDEDLIHSYSAEFKELYEKYAGGLWQSVAEARVDGVRTAINCWCRTDLSFNGKSLKDLALDTGCDYITTLLFKVDRFMRLVHHVLAQDVLSIRNWYATEKQRDKEKDNIYIFKWEPWGKVNLLQVAIQYQNCDLISELRANGERLSTSVGHPTEGDIPVFFTALESGTDAAVIEALLKDANLHKERIESLFAADLNPLQYAIRHDCCEEIISSLLHHGGPALLTGRDSSNLTALTLSQTTGKTSYTEIMTQYIMRWVTQPQNYPCHFQTTIILENLEMGEAEEFQQNAETSQLLHACLKSRDQIANLLLALETGDEQIFRDLLFFEIPAAGRLNLALGGRLPGTGLPLLHLAVLHNATSFVRLITQSESTGGSIDLDSVRDQFQKTALHYAYAIPCGREMIRILVNAGCSESVFDMYGRRPEDYREVRGSVEMQTLIQRLKNHDYSEPFQDPLDPDCIARHRSLQRRQRISSFLNGNHSLGHSHNHSHLTCCHLSQWAGPMNSTSGRYRKFWCNLL